MKKTFFGVVLIATAVCIQAQTLSWNIKFYKGKERETVSISRIISMKAGETFQIAIRPDADCYCYVVCYDSDRNIFVLKDLFLSGGSEITTDPIEITDPAGTETVYVIMSLKKQAQLESLIQTFNANPNSQQNANNLYREVVRLQNEATGLGEPANTFIASGGTTRGTTEEYATRFTHKDMYVRAIAIRH
jgi:hypothetical protein